MKQFVYLFLIVSLSCTILTQCGQQKTSDNNGLVVLLPLEQTKQITDLAPYIADMEVFQFEQNDKALLSYVKKTLKDDAGNYYVLDAKNNLVEFDKNGNYVRNIGRQGKGPKEYINIEDIALSIDQKEILVLSSTSVLCYNLVDSTSFREIKIPAGMPFDAIAPIENGGVYLYGSYPADPKDYRKKQPMVYRSDKDGNLTEENILREDMTFSIGNITQSQGNKYILRPQSSQHIVSVLSADSIQARYKIDFKEKNIPAQYYYETAGEDISSYMTAPYFKIPIYIFETDSLLYFKAAGVDAAECNFLYNTTNMTGINWIDEIADNPLIQMISSGDGYFDAIVYKDMLINYPSHTSQEHGALCRYIYENIKAADYAEDNDNPLVVRIKFQL